MQARSPQRPDCGCPAVDGGAATLYAALEARGHVDGQVPEGIAPPAPAAGLIDG